MQNARRFLSAYNKIDKAIREFLRLKPSIPFVDAVRRTAGVSAIVRRYEDDLIMYSRLRNSIVHNTEDDRVIAEPHLFVVEEMEKIATLLTTPPSVKGFAHKAVSLKADATILEAILTMQGGGYSNLPILSNGKIIGVITNKLIVEKIALLLKDGTQDLNQTLSTLSVATALSAYNEHYLIVPSFMTADNAILLYQQSPKLQILILTSNGKADGQLEGVITTSDIVKLNKALE